MTQSMGDLRPPRRTRRTRPAYPALPMRPGRPSREVLAGDVACAILGALALSLAVPSVARAYVDPSVVTYTIQAVAGVAVALGAVLGVAIRRTRRAIFHLLKIDENASKEVDPPVSTFAAAPEGAASEGAAAPATAAAADERARSLRRRLAEGRPVPPLRWGSRIWRALAACAFTVATIFVFTPLELVAASSQSLMFGLFDVTDLVFGVGATIAIACALAISLLRGRAFDFALTLVVAVGIGCYVQSLFLNTGLPAADGQPLDLMSYKRITAIDTAVWAAILCVLLVLTAKRRPVARMVLPLLSVVLLAIQAVSLAGIIADEAAETAGQQDPIVMSTYGINEVGAEGAVTVFVLDTFDTKLMDQLLAKDPRILDEYTGFTYFRNSTGSMIPTRYGVPFLLTNQFPEPGDDYDEFLASRYEKGTMLDDIAEQGYEITIYSDSVNASELEPYAANIHPTHHREFDDAKLWVSLQRMALSREAPWLLKPLFWFNTNEINANSLDAYYIDDVTYGQNLRNQGVSVSEDADKTFRFIHLYGSHWPFHMDEKGNRVASSDDTTVLRQTEGCLGFVTDYIRDLKELGLYDQTAIIVTADHGDWYLTEEPLDRTTTPVLLVKPVETAEEASQPLKVSQVPTGHVDVPATIIEAVGADPTPYGRTVFEIGDEPRDRYYWMTTHDGHMDHEWIQYVIQGDVLDFDDWHLTGERIPIEEVPLLDEVNVGLDALLSGSSGSQGS